MLKGFPPVPEVIGIYSDEPPDGTHDVIRSVQVADIGAVPLLRGITRWRDRLFDAAGELLT